MSDLELPSFKREDTVVITREEAPFAPEKQLGEYTLRRLSWYEKQRAFARSQQIIDETRGITLLSVEDYYAEMLYATVRECPKSLEVKADTPPEKNGSETEKTKTGWTIDFIKKELDIDIGDILRDICREINGLTEKEKRLFLPPSEQSEATPG